MEQVSVTPDERARKSLSIALQRISEVGQNTIASAIGVSAATVSRDVADLERAIKIISHAGIRLVTDDQVCVDKTMYQAIATIALGAMGNPETLKRLAIVE